ncbi:HugZ family protein [Mesorhizobium sp. CAU 1732]|uniref:HugZ family pyridoxamine 5'-phosphate oxidase n=1 Tax=Mesorhizobium sp. CAU 1732 TaxID=3140358 RepID=UPI0032617269
MEQKTKDVLRETDAEAVRLARTLLRSSRHGALAVLDPETGAPLASRVAVASDHDGAPLILVSSLSAHTGGLNADPRCSLLLGEPGKGDPLAHARITLHCHARRIARDDADHGRIEWRFLSRNPKSRLYSGFGDFSFFRLEPESASLNGGFGKAYALAAHDLLASDSAVEQIATAERGAVEHMNNDHSDAIANYAIYFGKAPEPAEWIMTGVDSDGFDLAAGDRILRIFFAEPLQSAQDMHKTLVAMAIEARKALATVGSE